MALPSRECAFEVFNPFGELVQICGNASPSSGGSYSTTARTQGTTQTPGLLHDALEMS